MSDKMPSTDSVWSAVDRYDEASHRWRDDEANAVDAAIHTYARAYAAQRVAPLAEALEKLRNALARRDDGMQGAGLLVAAAHDDCLAALAAEQRVINV